jgi:hypothetical protein
MHNNSPNSPNPHNTSKKKRSKDEITLHLLHPKTHTMNHIQAHA